MYHYLPYLHNRMQTIKKEEKGCPLSVWSDVTRSEVGKLSLPAAERYRSTRCPPAPMQCGQALWKHEAQGCQCTALPGTEACKKIPVQTNSTQSKATRKKAEHCTLPKCPLLPSEMSDSICHTGKCFKQKNLETLKRHKFDFWMHWAISNTSGENWSWS
jgi:hypothetical protein